MRFYGFAMLTVLLAAVVPAGARNYTAADLALIEQRVYEGVNDARAENGLAELALDEAVVRVAAGHAADMAGRGYFGHESPEGQTAGQRAAAAGIAYANFAENILKVDNPGQTPAKLAQTIVDGFLGSAGHRANLMKPNVTLTGVSVTRNGAGPIVVVQNFLEPAAAAVAAAPAPTGGKKKQNWQKPAAYAAGAALLYQLWKKKHKK